MCNIFHALNSQSNSLVIDNYGFNLNSNCEALLSADEINSAIVIYTCFSVESSNRPKLPMRISVFRHVCVEDNVDFDALCTDDNYTR